MTVTLLWLTTCVLLLNTGTTALTMTIDDCSFQSDRWICSMPISTELSFVDPVLGVFNVSSLVASTTTTTTSVSRCLLTNSATFVYKCDCSNSIGNNQCSLGQFYTLRSGPSFVLNGFLVCNSPSQKTWCIDTNWQPSSPFTCLDFSTSVSLNFTVSSIGPLATYLYPYSPTVSGLSLLNPQNYTLASRSGQLYIVNGSYDLFSATFALTSNDLFARLPNSSICNGTTISTYVTSGSITLPPRHTLSAFSPSYHGNVTFQIWPSNSWQYQLFKIGPTEISMAICRNLCHISVGGKEELVSSDFVAYGVYPPLGQIYQCITDKCMIKDCCLNPPNIQNPCSFVSGSVVCVEDIVFYNSTNSSFVPADPIVNYYCSTKSGACYPPINRDWEFTALAIVLITACCFLTVIVVFFLIRILYPYMVTMRM